MSGRLALHIRDGKAADVPTCLQLDHSYRSAFAWQVRFDSSGDRLDIRFQAERLPRDLETVFVPDEARLQRALAPEHCFLVALDQEHDVLLGYLALSTDPVRGFARLHDIVVTRPWRRCGIGLRMLTVARKWAREREPLRLVAELRTHNFPAIRFFQRAGLRFSGYSDHVFPRHEIAVFFGEVLR